MINFIVNALASALGKEAVSGIFEAIASSQMRKTIRRSIRDLVEDEVQDTMRDLEIPNHEIDRYIKNKKSYYKEEIRARFDPILKKR